MGEVLQVTSGSYHDARVRVKTLGGKVTWIYVSRLTVAP